MVKKIKKIMFVVYCVVCMVSVAACKDKKEVSSEEISMGAGATVSDASVEDDKNTLTEGKTTEQSDDIKKETTEKATAEATTEAAKTTESVKTTEAVNVTDEVKTTAEATTEATTEAVKVTTEATAPITTPSATQAATVCTHDWTPVYKTVHHDAVTEEKEITKEVPVTKRVSTTKCKACGWICNPDGSNGTYEEHVKNSGTKIVIVFGEEHEVPVCDKSCAGVGVDVTTYETVTTKETVVVSEAYDEKVIDYYTCTKCGATK